MDETAPAPASLPAALRPLGEIAHNFWWSWSASARSLFSELDPEGWEATGHNPVRLIERLGADRAAAAAADAGFVARARAARDEMARELAGPTWFDGRDGDMAGEQGPFLAAYFCAEFGLTECFQIYSGGLGLLAGDHLKSASQLGLPLIGVGLLYRNGYFHQRLEADGMQGEAYPALEPATQPVRRVLDPTVVPLVVRVEMPGRGTACGVWRADVGRVRLYLLDTDLDENPAEDREITANLYLGDQRRRIEQEIVLGIGGVRALEAVGERPTVFHMNEGHAAFMAIERIRRVRERFPHLSFDQAREAAAPGHVFTTHTPVPAGIDRFNAGLVRQYFGDYHAALGLDLEGFMALGRENVADRAEAFSMAVLALRTSKFCNGVSALHGAVSRRMWRNLWPETPVGDVPIGHVTNGVHTASWVSPTLAALFDKRLGDPRGGGGARGWRERPHDPASWAGIADVPDAELWAARNADRATFIDWARRKAESGQTGGVRCGLDPHALTIGFARRFAGYKRATLLFRDPERLRRILTGEGVGRRPVQLVISGKAHPGDTWGKHLIRDIVQFSRQDGFGGRILFIEDYDIEIARHMVRGCDVWLNTPIRGLEASGTSGMKAAINGVLHASILDGWWDEGYVPAAGYMVPDRGIYPNDAPDDDREEFESESLYALIEGELVRDFYAREGQGGPPAAWIARMKGCIAALAPRFSTHRMVIDYAENYYFPAHRAAARMNAGAGGGDLREARELADRIDRYRRAWPGVRVKSFECAADASAGTFSVGATVRLAGLGPEETLVQVCHGRVDGAGEIPEGSSVTMAAKGPVGDTAFHYTATLSAPGVHGDPRYGVRVRVLPGDDRLVNPYVPGLVVNGPVCPLEPDQGAHV